MKARRERFASFTGASGGVSRLLLVLAAGACLLQSVPKAQAQAAFRPNIITTIAGNGTMGTTPGANGDGGPATSAEFEFALLGQIGIDGAGNTYILDTNNVRKIDAVTGIITNVAGNGNCCSLANGQPGDGDGGPATQAPLWFPEGLAVDKAGNIYISEVEGDRVRKVDASTGIITLFAGGTTGYSGDGGPATSAALDAPEGLCVDAAGNVYIIDAQNNVIRKVTVATGIITTVAGNGTYGYSGDGGPATSAAISPSSIVMDATGDLLIGGVDQRVRLVQASNGYIYTVAGTGVVGSTGDGGPPTSAELYYPAPIDIIGEFKLFTADEHRVRVSNISSAINTINPYAGTGVDGNTGDGGPATAAEIGNIYGLTHDSSGNIYIVDNEHFVVRKVSAASSKIAFQTTAINSTSPSVSVQIELGAAESVSSIASVASVGGKTEFNVTSISGCPVNGSTVNAAGTICTVTLTFSPAYAGLRQAPLRVITSGGTVDFPLSGEGTGPQVTFYPTTYSLIGGNGTAGYSGDNGAATSAEFNTPEGLAMDNAGDLFVSDALNYRVRRIDGSTHVVTTVAGNGSQTGATASGGPATTSSIGRPVATVADAAGNLFVSDYYNSVVWRVDATSKTVVLYAGGGTGADGGPAYGASLSAPGGLALDNSGNLYISDNSHYRIRRVDAVTGVITTVAGSGTAGYSGDNGAATSAELKLPGSLAFDLSGNLYISDGNNYRIRKVNMTTGIITTVAGNGSSSISGDGGLATSAGIGTLAGFTLDAAGDLYIAAGTSLRLVNSATGIIESLISGVFTSPCCTVLDGLGNIYIADVDASKLYKMSPATPPSLSFASTAVSSTSSDSPQTVTLENIGTSTLEFAIPGTGNNPSISTNFGLSSGSSANCPLLTSSSYSQQPLSSGASCILPVSFTPTVPGSISGSLVVKDNASNVSGTTQTIPLNGTGIAALAKFSLTGLINAPALTAQTVTLTAQEASGSTYTGYTGTVHFTSTDGLAVLPANYTFVAADNGVHTFPVTLKTAGSQTVTATDTVSGDYGSETVTVGSLAATVTLGSLSATYDGTAHAATATTNPAGLTVTFTYNGSATAPTAAGSYAVVGTISDPTYSGSATGTLVIAKAAATVTLGSLSAVYNGSPHAATATTSPSGLTVNFTYNGSSTAPTVVGSYTVVGTISDANYMGSASGTLVISTGSATVTLGSLSAVYNGSPHAATATTSPSGLTVNFTYNGSATAPTAAGSYTVVGTINDPNYTGSATGTLVISKAAATVTLGNLAVTYNGSPQSATATTTPSSLTVTLTYNGSATAPTAVGSYTVVGTISDTNYSGSATGTFVISKAAATVTLGSLTATYDGNPHAATATTTPVGLSVTLTCNGSSIAPSAVGSYTVAGTISDTNYTGSATGTLVISSGSATVTLGSLNAVYNGSPHAATATTTPAGLNVTFTYNGSATPPTAAGSYTVVGTINDPNYAGSASGTLAISKATATVTLGSLAATYNGSAHAATATSSPAGLAVTFTYNGSATAPTAAGSYTVAGTVNDPNYAGSATGTLVISSANATVTLGSLAAAYNGSPHAATATTSPAGLTVNFTYNGSATAPTAAGTYTVVGTISDPNYTGSATGTLTISDGSATVVLANLSATYDGNPHAATATTTPAGLAVAITYNGSATAPTAAGSYAVVAIVSDPNYAGSASGTLVIGAANAIVTLANLSVTYDGNPHAATATTTPAGLAVSFTYNGSSTAPTIAGSYTVVATVTSGNYTGSSTGTLVISNANATVMLSNLSATYDGQMHPATATTVPAGLAVTLTYNGATAAPVAAGSYAVVATVTSSNYSGSANGPLAIAKATPTMNLSSSSTSVAPNQTVTLTANVIAAAGGPANGSVVFYDNGTPLGTFSLMGGAATDTQLLSAGTTHTITATYSGDADFVPVTSSASGPVVINVAAFDYTFQASGSASQFVALNSTVSYTFAISPQYGSYPGQVNFSAVGLPQGASAKFSPATLSSTAGAQTVTMTVYTSSILSMQRPNALGSAAKSLPLLAFLMLPLFTRRSARRRFTVKMFSIAFAVISLVCASGLTGCGWGINYFDHIVTVNAASGTLQHVSSVELKLK